MCGIGGCVTRDGGAPPPGRLKALCEAMAHRGPDGWGIEVVGGVGLVHRRLSILDPTRAAGQPMHLDDWWLSYNGEIYNHLALREELGDEDLHYRSTGDTETLIHTLRRFGAGAVERLNGQFAFAAVDSGAGRLLLARDRFGIKPLFLAEDEVGLWWASDPSALLAAGIPATPAVAEFDALLEGETYRSDDTLLAGVGRLPPGTCLEVDLADGQRRTWRWSSVADHLDDAGRRRLSSRPREALVDELEQTLRSAVHDALISDVGIGSLCSGGVDSTLVSALAMEVRPDLVLIGASFPGEPDLDDGPAIRRAAEALGADIDLLEVTRETWLAGFVAATLAFGAPLPNPSSVIVAQMAARARERGVKVVLTGEGADELFGGYIAADDPGFVAATTTGPDRESAVAALETRLVEQFDHNLAHLLTRMDANTMQESIEARVPFLDPRLVRLALNLPFEARMQPMNKGILRDVARRHLPEDLAYRPKVYGMMFSAPAEWLKDAGRSDFLRRGHLREHFDVSDGMIRWLLNASPPRAQIQLWSAEVWCRSVISGQSRSEIEGELWT